MQRVAVGGVERVHEEHGLIARRERDRSTRRGGAHERTGANQLVQGVLGRHLVTALTNALARRLSTAAQRPRLSRNTACSPKRFQNHQGALSRSGEPQALRATALSILAPIATQSCRKSLIVQW